MKSPLADDLLQIHEHASYSEDYPATGLTALRLASGLSRDDVYDISGVLVLELELHEEHGGWPSLPILIGLAEAYECTPGELVDAVACLEEAQQHDLPAERETRRQADKLLEMLRERGTIFHEEMENAGIKTNNFPFNDLHDRGYPVEIVRSAGVRSQRGTPVGVRLRQEES